MSGAPVLALFYLNAVVVFTISVGFYGHRLYLNVVGNQSIERLERH